ncbi:MAG TPA: ribonuclease H-like domain-containing protein [Candidatus Lokiarchaeia archaeon]|nr:ribonuclease H-like domain-containing protein [Candidatus Lokiarchaeia archaeon]
MTFSDHAAPPDFSAGEEFGEKSECQVFPSLEELYPDAVERENEEGTFLEIPRSTTIPPEIIPPFSKNRRRLYRKLELVQGIGPRTAQICRQRGTSTIAQLIYNRPRYAPAAREVKWSLDAGDYVQLATIKSLKDIDFIHCFKLSEVLFFDIENLGFHNQPLFMIATGWFSDIPSGQFSIRQWFARDIGEEAAILREFLDDLPNYKCIVSYNGKTFDLNVLRARSIYYFDDEFCSRLASAPGGPENVGVHHIDLFHASRRLWKGENFEDFRLATLESNLLDIKRDETKDIRSAEVPRVYRHFLEDPSDTADIYKVIEHNYHDVITLAFLLGKVLYRVFSSAC